MQNRTKHVLQQTVGVGLHPLERGTVGSRRLKRLLEESGFCLDDDELELLGHHCWQRGRIQKSRTIGWYPKHSVNPEREHQQHRLNKFVFNNYFLKNLQSLKSFRIELLNRPIRPFSPGLASGNGTPPPEWN